MATSKLSFVAGFVDSFLTEEDIERLLQAQKNLCFICEHEIGEAGAYVSEPGGPIVVNAPHHVHCSYESACVERIICEACYAIVTGQKFPCKDVGVPVFTYWTQPRPQPHEPGNSTSYSPQFPNKDSAPHAEENQCH